MAPGLPKFKIGPFPDFRSSDNTTVIPPSICRCSDSEEESSGNCAKYSAGGESVYAPRDLSDPGTSHNTIQYVLKFHS